MTESGNWIVSAWWHQDLGFPSTFVAVLVPELMYQAIALWAAIVYDMRIKFEMNSIFSVVSLLGGKL